MSRRFFVSIAGLFVVLSPGAVYAFSLLSGPLGAAFGWKPQQVSWAFALFSLFIAVGGAIGGVYADRMGPRRTALIGAVVFSAGYALCGTLAFISDGGIALQLLYLFYGALAGTGSGMVYIAAMVAVMRWSKTRRGLAGGFVIMGFGLGSFVYGFILRSWPDFTSIQASSKIYADAYAAATLTNRHFEARHYLLPQADVQHLMLLFVVSGVAFLAITLAAARFIALPDAASSSASFNDYTQTEMFADARFYVIWAILFLNVFGGSMIIGSAASIISELSSLPIATAALLYSFLALCNGFGRLAFGALSDRIGRRYTFVSIFAMQALAFILLDALHDPVGVCIAIGLLLLAYGGGFGTVPAAMADIFGTKNFGSIYGATLSAWGLAAVMGQYFVNALRATGGSYIGMMQPLSLLVLTALFFPMIIEARSDKKRKSVSTVV
jgi:OFA family oxalate/formate antiporter-like MFS transporter